MAADFDVKENEAALSDVDEVTKPGKTEESMEVTKPDETDKPKQASKPKQTAKQKQNKGRPKGPAKKGGKRPPQPKKVKSTKQLLVGLLIKIAVIAIVVWALLTFILSISIQHGNNMHPSVRDGDLICSFRLDKPYINAVVMYEHDGHTMVGRVIALEGSEVDVKTNGEFTVDGATPSEEVFYPTYPASESKITYPYKVGEGQAFILNDFREDAFDSRSFGAVSVKDIKGPMLFTMRRRGF